MGQRDYSTSARAVRFNTEIEFNRTFQTPSPVVTRHQCQTSEERFAQNDLLATLKYPDGGSLVV